MARPLGSPGEPIAPGAGDGGAPDDRAGEDRTGEGDIEPGKRLIRVAGDRSQSLAERLAARLHRLAWRTPLHTLRLRGRYPLKLLGVPADPIAGDVSAGRALMGGRMIHLGESLDLETMDLAAPGLSPGFVDTLHGFAWLRDLAAAAPRERAAPVAEAITREWLATHGAQVAEPAWRADIIGRRILFWGAHAPLILSSADVVYRSAVLNNLARAARHLDRGAEKAEQGLPRLTAFAGVIAAGLLIPGGDARLAAGEAGLARAMAASLYGDGGLANRSPVAQLELVELLAQLRAVYLGMDREPHEAVSAALSRAVPALLGVTLGDGGLSSWQGGAPIAAARVAAAIEASGVRARPLRQARDWGYQRLGCGQAVLVLDAAPPPASRLAAGGCASTLAFEFSDGAHRLIVNCGGPRGGGVLPAEFAEALRSTAAHSTLIVADSNSTAIHDDGSLGRGVTEVELDRHELEGGSRLDVSHDGYARRFGFIHRRQLLLSGDGRELKGEDVLLPANRRRRASDAGFAIRFHLAPGIEVTPTADEQGALLRLPGGPLWQFRCKGAALATEESLWIDPAGRPRGSVQIVMTGEAAAGGASVSWLFRRAA
ncbi:heparinase II/III family protein [Sphingomonas profundi]|uniref:heparinase II/III family protein n=1 Tax=Alterirhizorhabdus profundi TaxID=2681549 RepID=UPI0012E7408D|nr:heparinase II/III family protein [Sphingomonas profundi]